MTILMILPKNISNVLYDCAVSSGCSKYVHNVDNNMGRWERLMEDKNDERIMESYKLEK